MEKETKKKKGFVQVFQENLPHFFCFAFIMALIFIAVTFVTFFAFVRPAEQVMVPNVVGKDLPEALIILQAKELYPKLILQYTDSPKDKGRVLAQSIAEGTISKAGRRILLTVSQGAPISEVENFVGQNLLDVQLHIRSIFADADSALISLADPMFVESDRPLNTVLEQDPAAGTKLTEKTPLHLVVSKGSNVQKIKIPSLAKADVAKIYDVMQTSEIVFDFAAKESDEKTFCVASQNLAAGTETAAWSNLAVSLLLPKADESGRNVDENDLICGIFEFDLPNYPFATPIAVDMTSESGRKTPVARFKHIGGKFTFPYAVSEGTQLIFSINGKQFAEKTIK